LLILFFSVIYCIIFLVYLILIIVAAIIILGFVFGVFLLVMVVSKLIHRHFHIIKRGEEAKVYYVADLSNAEQAAQKPVELEDQLPMRGNLSVNEELPLMGKKEKKIFGV